MLANFMVEFQVRRIFCFLKEGVVPGSGLTGGSGKWK